VQVRVDDNLDRALEDLARAQHRSKSAVVRDALAAYVARH
jgi:predicted transcriptional regulator